MINVRVYFFGASDADSGSDTDSDTDTDDEVWRDYQLADGSTVADLRNTIVGDNQSPLYGEAISAFEIIADPPDRRGGVINSLTDRTALVNNDGYHAVMQ